MSNKVNNTYYDPDSKFEIGIVFGALLAVPVVLPFWLVARMISVPIKGGCYAYVKLKDFYSDIKYKSYNKNHKER